MVAPRRGGAVYLEQACSSSRKWPLNPTTGRDGPMATVDEGIAAQIRNIEARYGKPMSDWFALIAASGLTKHTEVVALLKAEHGMTHGAAHRVSLLSRQAAAPAPVSA